MVSEKLDLVLAAENAAGKRTLEAENAAEEIIRAAKVRSCEIISEKTESAKSKAKAMISDAEVKCGEIAEEYKRSAEKEITEISHTAAKNEMYGMNTVIKMIIP